MRRRHMFDRVSHLFLVIMLLVVVSFSIAGCGTNEDVRDKLDSRLNPLVDAEKRGETESFARMAGFDLVDGSVRVLIDYVPGQLEAAVKAAERFGTVETIDYSAKKVQALIPIASLTALAKEESIRFIRDPVESAPE